MTESKELLAAQAEPLTELPLEGFYGGKPKRFTIEYDDLSSTCIGNANGSVDNIVRNLLAHSTPDPRIAELEDLIDEYLHWRSVNKHIKGGENYLKRMKQALTSSKEPTNNQHEATNDQ